MFQRSGVRGRTTSLLSPQAQTAQRREDVPDLFLHLRALDRRSRSRVRLLASPVRSLPRLLALLRHELGAEDPLRLVLIVCPAAEPKPLHGVLPTARIHVVELQEAPGAAPMSIHSLERASALIPVPDGVPDVRGD